MGIMKGLSRLRLRKKPDCYAQAMTLSSTQHNFSNTIPIDDNVAALFYDLTTIVFYVTSRWREEDMDKHRRYLENMAGLVDDKAPEVCVGS